MSCELMLIINVVLVVFLKAIKKGGRFYDMYYKEEKNMSFRWFFISKVIKILQYSIFNSASLKWVFVLWNVLLSLNVFWCLFPRLDC